MVVEVQAQELESFKAWAKGNRFGWPAALSTNQWRETWPPTGRGYTQSDDRMRLHGRFAFVDQIVKAYLERRPPGGRFFIDEQLAWYKPEEDGNPSYGIAAIRIIE
jgi:hypothetical protein